MALTTLSDVRLLSNITAAEVSDADMTNIIAEATVELTSKLNVNVIRERIARVDSTRPNDIDGSNTTYYTTNWKGKFLSDRDLDGDIDVSDVIVYVVDSDDDETTATVSSIDFDDSKFVLDTAYDSTNTLYVTYAWSYYDLSTPDPLVNLAATYLAAAYAYLKRDAGVDGIVRFGNVTINQSLSSSYGEYYRKYQQLCSELTKGSVLGKEGEGSWIQSKVAI